MNKKRIFAIVGIIILAGLYVVALICAIIDNPIAADILKASFLLTIALPVLLYVYTLMIKMAKDRKANRETGIIDEKLLENDDENSKSDEEEVVYDPENNNKE